jgi:hypothetical protein
MSFAVCATRLLVGVDRMMIVFIPTRKGRFAKLATRKIKIHKIIMNIIARNKWYAAKLTKDK